MRLFPFIDQPPAKTRDATFFCKRAIPVPYLLLNGANVSPVRQNSHQQTFQEFLAMFGTQHPRLSRRPLDSRSLRFEQCEDRRLMAADLHVAAPLADTTLAAPVAPPSNGIIAILIGLYRTPASSPTSTASATTAKPSNAISVDVWEHAALSDPGFDRVS